ncbi:hypothetical protein OPT61_g9588 [Boeremia exigua]|uniref:Uncharacterized protein n=1 Tax=Boeremia exigua TaxID=749465 RepID=A0ACC2HTK4_9PLEO|nr:hypothetical protein OPT61_g9588 [Boeremia exigua]
MADDQNAEVSSDAPSIANKAATALSPPSYSAWRTGAHLYMPFVTMALLIILDSPYDTAVGNTLWVGLSAIPTNWLASLLYPTDRPEPTPAQAIRFSRKSGFYRAIVLYTFHWHFLMPNNLELFIKDYLMTLGIGWLIGERPAGTKQRRSEFGTHLLWVAGSALLMFLAPSFLPFWQVLASRVIMKAAYVALVDDIVGLLARPNVKSWQGKIRLVLVQAFVILFICRVLLRWAEEYLLARENHAIGLEALEALQKLDKTEELFDDDGDRFLV